MANPTILVTGSKGQLGSSLQLLSEQALNFDWIFTDIDELNISDKKQIEDFFDKTRPSYLVNCAAYTAVDKAEKDSSNASLLNKVAPAYLAEICSIFKTKFIHVSTDYVFDGSKNTPYNETCPVSPLGVYGKTKYEGEQGVIKKCPDSIILRTSWLYSEYGNNFVKTMIRLASEKPKLNVIFDQTGTPTYAGDLASAIIRIIEHDYISNEWYSGIYHYSNEGVCSWFDFATEIINYVKFNCIVQPIETYEYPSPAKRPHYSVLNKKKIKSVYKIDIPYWKNSLYKCVNNLLGT
jgi:dTDP-4-dehydrorhamnose reductase